MFLRWGPVFYSSKGIWNSETGLSSTSLSLFVLHVYKTGTIDQNRWTKQTVSREDDKNDFNKKGMS